MKLLVATALIALTPLAMLVPGSAFNQPQPKPDHFWQRRGALIDAIKTPSYIAEYRLRFGPQSTYAGSGGGLGYERRIFDNGLTYFDHQDDKTFRQWRDEFTQEELDAWSDAGYHIPEYTAPMRVHHPETYALILTQHRRVENGDRDYLFGGKMVVTRDEYEEACAFLGKTP